MKYESIFEEIKEMTDVSFLKELQDRVIDRLRILREVNGSDIRHQLMLNQNLKVLLKIDYCTGKGLHLFNKKGTVVKCNPKKAKVTFEGDDVRVWTVPYGMLEIVK